MEENRLTTTQTLSVEELPQPRKRNDMTGHPRNRIRVLDLFSGRGGVGLALDVFFNRLPEHAQLIGDYLGVDKKDYSVEYPSAFIQADITTLSLSDLPLDQKADLVWASPPCQPYAKPSSQWYDNLPEDHPLPSIPDLNLREICDQLGKEFVIENVPGCDDLRDDHTVKVNGAAFGLPLNFERCFEVSFIDTFTQHGTTDYRAPLPEDIIRFQYATIDDLLSAKAIPSEHISKRSWSQQEARAAIPPNYVAFILTHCPTLDDLTTPSGSLDWWTEVSLTPGQHSLSFFYSK